MFLELLNNGEKPRSPTFRFYISTASAQWLTDFPVVLQNHIDCVFLPMWTLHSLRSEGDLYVVALLVPVVDGRSE